MNFINILIIELIAVVIFVVCPIIRALNRNCEIEIWLDEKRCNKITRAIKSNNYAYLFKLTEKAKREIEKCHLKNFPWASKTTEDLLAISFLYVIENYNITKPVEYIDNNGPTVADAYKYAKFLGNYLLSEFYNQPELFTSCSHIAPNLYFIISIDDTLTMDRKVELIHVIGQRSEKREILKCLNKSNPEFAKQYASYIEAE